MGRLQDEAERLMNPYRRKGGGPNRKKQVNNALRFVEHLERYEHLPDWTRLGKRHVIRFYKSHRHLSASTIDNYYYAIRHLFEVVGSDLEVPRPFKDCHRGAQTTV